MFKNAYEETDSKLCRPYLYAYLMSTLELPQQEIQYCMIS